MKTIIVAITAVLFSCNSSTNTTSPSMDSVKVANDTTVTHCGAIPIKDSTK
jgi:hypothetical protein